MEEASQAGVCTDACEYEQTALLHKYVLSRPDAPSGEWSSQGPRSLAPFSPCAESRQPHIFAAARLTQEDVLYDLGCGDGRVLREAAARYGCRCVGIEVDEDCLASCRNEAAALGPGVADLFRWELADMGELADDFFVTGQLSEGVAPLPVPTVVLIFITGHGLVALADWLHRAWRLASHGIRILTCVEALDTARDYNQGVFADTNLQNWEVYRDPLHARYGVFVVPPVGCSLKAWECERPTPVPTSRCVGEESQPVPVHGLLSAEDIVSVQACVDALAADSALAEGDEDVLASALFGEGDAWSLAEDAMHGMREHRVLHLHREGVDASALRHIRAKLLRAMFQLDGRHWGLLRGRAVFVRSFEHHGYEPGGSVMDPEHVDGGSLLTITVLLARSADCEGGILRTCTRGVWHDHVDVEPGDAVVFVSEKRHNVTPITAGTRKSLVMELWESGVTRRNRHE